MPHLKMREYRLKRGLTLEQVGERTYYSWSSIQQAEVGKMYNGRKRKDPRTEAFWQTMSDFYDISIPTLRRWVKDGD